MAWPATPHFVISNATSWWSNNRCIATARSARKPAPGFIGDPLRVWREVTARRGVSLYMHYSGVWDSEAILQHPDWGAIDSNGKPNGKAASFFGPYAEKLLVLQLRELGGDYGVDGLWVDGECWASVADYGAAAVAAFQKSTGLSGVPRQLPRRRCCDRTERDQVL